MSDEQPASSPAPAAGGSPLALFDNFLGRTPAARMLTYGIAALLIAIFIQFLGGAIAPSARFGIVIFREGHTLFFNLGLIFIAIGLVRELAWAKR